MTIFLALQWLYDACLVVTVVIGWRYGGRSERCGVLIVTIGTLVTLAIMQPPVFDWRMHREALIAVDIAVLLAFARLALRSTRFWPIWATAFHLITVASHFAIVILPPPLLQTYALFQGFWVYPILACIIVAALARRKRRHSSARPGHQTGEPPN